MTRYVEIGSSDTKPFLAELLVDGVPLVINPASVVKAYLRRGSLEVVNGVLTAVAASPQLTLSPATAGAVWSSGVLAIAFGDLPEEGLFDLVVTVSYAGDDDTFHEPDAVRVVKHATVFT